MSTTYERLSFNRGKAQIRAGRKRQNIQQTNLTTAGEQGIGWDNFAWYYHPAIGTHRSL